jgi:hypothetical protein
MDMIPGSDGFVINTIARAHGDGVAETTAKWPGGDHGRAPTGETLNAMDARGVDGLRQGHIRQDGGEAARQHRLARPRWAEHEHVWVRTPAFASALHPASLRYINQPQERPIILTEARQIVPDLVRRCEIKVSDLQSPPQPWGFRRSRCAVDVPMAYPSPRGPTGCLRRACRFPHRGVSPQCRACSHSPLFSRAASLSLGRKDAIDGQKSRHSIFNISEYRNIGWCTPWSVGDG